MPLGKREVVRHKSRGFANVSHLDLHIGLSLSCKAYGPKRSYKTVNLLLERPGILESRKNELLLLLVSVLNSVLWYACAPTVEMTPAMGLR